MGTKWAPKSTKTRYKTAFCIRLFFDGVPEPPKERKWSSKVTKMELTGAIFDAFLINFRSWLEVFYSFFIIVVSSFLHLLVSGCSRIRLKLNLMDDDNELPCPTLEKNAMSY